MRLALVIFSYSLFLGVANAETDANKFLKDFDTGTIAARERLSDNLSLVESGMSWVNVYIAEERKERPLYCPPNTLAPTGEQLVDILRKEVEGSPEESDRAVGFVLMRGLQKAFPCQAK